MTLHPRAIPFVMVKSAYGDKVFRTFALHATKYLVWVNECFEIPVMMRGGGGSDGEGRAADADWYIVGREPRDIIGPASGA
mmetsp:Transcript_24700/g.29846  ORF Transcript_24700/g.29846 Transcript_24700/m.29846 type:complete len:81 (+) Transcript_24700:581-823(+)